VIVILIGVTGTGKTTVGQALAQATGWQFADADDFHSQANRTKMHGGIPLTDEDRDPWLRSLHEQIAEWVCDGVDGILACSALRESYRVTLTREVPPDSLRFIHLTGPAEVIHERLVARQGHYMPASLLPSQMAALEPPHDAVEVSIVKTVPEIVQEILRILNVAPRGAYAGENGTELI
jgi:gluconokinase